jgi:hypothetical protein
MLCLYSQAGRARILLILCVILLSGCQAQNFISKMDGSASTPPNNTVLPSTCSGSPTSMICSPVSFLILTNPATVQSLILDPINSTIFNADNSIPCPEPATLFDQRCGVDTVFVTRQLQSSSASDWGVAPDTFSGCTLVASCDFGSAGTGRCSCAFGSGTCQCFNTTRLTVRPILFRGVQDSRICFTAVLR